MINYETAMDLIGSLRAELGHERLPLSACNGRRLAADLHAKIPSPPFTNSAMDGFAVAGSDAVAGTPLTVSGTLFAKATRSDEIPAYQKGACVRIMTGAVLPPWADTVVPVELSEPASGGRVTLKEIPQAGENIRREGEDVTAGACLLKAGTRLDPERLMVAAAFGYPELDVAEQPRILLLATGDELCEPGETLPLGAVYNSSRYFLTAAVESLGLKIDRYATLADDEAAAAATLKSLLAASDRPTLILTTGAVSAGDKDFIPRLAAGLGFQALFHKVAIRPGKPVFLAETKRGAGSHAVWLGLPGNPISTCVGWHFFARPVLSAWIGAEPAPRRSVRLKNAVTKPEGMRCFYRAEVNGDYAWVGRSQGSAALAPSVNVEAYVVLPEGTARVAADTKVEALFV
jgi:molybdopterin molybdotransferase